MPANTPILNLPYPVAADTADVPRDIQALATAIDPLGVVPVGASMMWLTAAPPAGWLLLNGQQVSATTYPKLAALFGQSGGMVTLPNLTQRMPIGAGGAYALGGTGGAETVALSQAQMPVHSHAITDPKHGHADTFAIASAGAHQHSTVVNGRNVPTSNAGWDDVLVGSGGYRVPTTSGSADIQDETLTSSAGSHAHTLNGAVSTAATGISAANAGNGDAHNNVPPYYVVHFIVRAG